MVSNEIAPIPIPPGATLLEYLVNWNMTQKELSLRLGISTKHVNEIIKGKSPITNETAFKLESVLGLPASFWIGLEASYQEAITRLNIITKNEEEENIARSINYAEIAKLGWVAKTRAIQTKIENLRAFFGIASLEYIPKLIPGAFRKSSIYESSDLALATWLRKGELIAQEIQTEKYLKSKIKKAIPKIKKLTMKRSEEFFSNLISLCADCGIALALVPHISKTHANGAIKWINSEKVILQLSFKGAYADIFWFSLFHELGHIYYEHNKKETLIENLDPNSRIEDEADAFARDMLISDKDYKRFISSGLITESGITIFADEIGIHPGIVVGRLMHDEIIDYSQFAEIREKCTFEIN